MGKKRGRSDIGASCLLAQRLLKGSQEMRGSGQETYTLASASQDLSLQVCRLLPGTHQGM